MPMYDSRKMWRIFLRKGERSRKRFYLDGRGYRIYLSQHNASAGRFIRTLEPYRLRRGLE